MQILKIPKASENLEEATIGKWLKAQGDPVAAGEPVVEILTDKADFELEADESGYLRSIAAPEKSTVPVGYAIGIIAGKDDPLPAIDAENAALLQAGKAAATGTSHPAPETTQPAGPRIAATPAARRIAREHRVDLADVAAALRKPGVISAQDVEEYLKSL